jgi:hypothetical protein
MNAIQVLGRAMARRQISRFQIGPMSNTKLRSLDRASLVRYGTWLHDDGRFKTETPLYDYLHAPHPELATEPPP